MMAVSTELSATEITCVCFPTSGIEEFPIGQPVIFALGHSDAGHHLLHTERRCGLKKRCIFIKLGSVPALNCNLWRIGAGLNFNAAWVRRLA